MPERYIWNVDEEGSHQLVHVKGSTTTNGSVATYRCPSTIERDDYILAIFTQYWEGLFPTEEVLKITKEAKARMKDVVEL